MAFTDYIRVPNMKILQNYRRQLVLLSLLCLALYSALFVA